MLLHAFTVFNPVGKESKIQAYQKKTLVVQETRFDQAFCIADNTKDAERMEEALNKEIQRLELVLATLYVSQEPLALRAKKEDKIMERLEELLKQVVTIAGASGFVVSGGTVPVQPDEEIPLDDPCPEEEDSSGQFKRIHTPETDLVVDTVPEVYVEPDVNFEPDDNSEPDMNCVPEVNSILAANSNPDEKTEPDDNSEPDVNYIPEVNSVPVTNRSVQGWPMLRWDPGVVLNNVYPYDIRLD